MTKEEIKQQCEALSDHELLLVVNNKAKYTALIVAAAQMEIKKRALSKEDIRSIKKEIVRRDTISGNIIDEISFRSKLFFFFLSIFRITWPARNKFRRENYLLKLRQSAYYAIAGGVTFLSIPLLTAFFPIGIRFMIWALSFLPVYILERYYVTQKMINRLRSMSGEPQAIPPSPEA